MGDPATSLGSCRYRIGRWELVLLCRRPIGIVTDTLTSRVGIALIGVLAFVLAAIPASAASCAEPLSLDQALDASGIVFVGMVDDVEYDGRLAFFEVEEVWKGDVEGRVVVSGGPSLSELEQAESDGQTIVTSIDRTFTQGEVYLVVPFGLHEGIYMDNGCSATRPYDDSLREFRPVSAHPPLPASKDISEDVVVARIALGALVIGAAVGGVVSVVRRRSGWRTLARPGLEVKD